MKRRVKRTLLDDFMKVYNSLECKGVRFTCLNCPNKIICDILETVIN